MSAGDDLVNEIGPHLAALAEALTGTRPTSRSPREIRFRTKGSLSIKLTGVGAPCWHDHEAGVGGDALGLVAHLRQCTMREAAIWTRAWLGTDRPVPPPTPRLATASVRESDTADLARRLWDEATNPAETLVTVYLASRGLTLPADAPIRCHHRAWRNRQYGPPGPAMVALMTDPTTAAPVGVHVTYLAADGSEKAEGERQKIMLGNTGVVRLVPDDEVTVGLGIAEGIETALSVIQTFGWSPVWAATSAGAIARFPVLGGIEALTIFADMDDRGAGIVAAMDCAAQWRAAGREVVICAAPKGQDMNDAARRAA